MQFHLVLTFHVCVCYCRLLLDVSGRLEDPRQWVLWVQPLQREPWHRQPEPAGSGQRGPQEIPLLLWEGETHIHTHCPLACSFTLWHLASSEAPTQATHTLTQTQWHMTVSLALSTTLKMSLSLVNSKEMCEIPGGLNMTWQEHTHSSKAIRPVYLGLTELNTIIQ